MSCCKRPGVLLALIAAFLIALNTVFANKVAKKVDFMVMSTLMFTIMGFISTPLMLKDEEWLKASKIQWVLAIVSGILSGIYVFTRMESMKYISPVDTSALTQTQLVFVVILAWLWLKEPLELYEIIFILIIMCGSILVTQPEFMFRSNKTNPLASRYIGIILAVLTAIISAVMACTVRKLHTVNPYLITYLHGIVAGMTLLILITIRTSEMPNLEEWLYIIPGCVGGAITAILFTLAYKREPASVVTAIYSSEILFTAVFQIIIIQSIPNKITILGALFILVGVVAITIKDNIIHLFY